GCCVRSLSRDLNITSYFSAVLTFPSNLSTGIKSKVKKNSARQVSFQQTSVTSPGGFAMSFNPKRDYLSHSEPKTVAGTQSLDNSYPIKVDSAEISDVPAAGFDGNDDIGPSNYDKSSSS